MFLNEKTFSLQPLLKMFLSTIMSLLNCERMSRLLLNCFPRPLQEFQITVTKPVSLYIFIKRLFNTCCVQDIMLFSNTLCIKHFILSLNYPFIYTFLQLSTHFICRLGKESPALSLKSRHHSLRPPS